VDKFVEKAKQIKDAADTTGLTVSQLQALSSIGRQVGLDFDETERFTVRLALAIQDLRTKGSGPLFDVLAKINPQLVLQVANAKDLAEAIDIVARATKNLTDQQQKLELAAAGGGRRGAAGGVRLLQAIPEGGIAGATGGTDKEFVDRVVTLRREIDAINRATDKIYGEMFAINTLNAQKQSAEFWRQIAQSIKDTAANTPGLAKFLESASRGIQKAIDAGRAPTLLERFGPLSTELPPQRPQITISPGEDREAQLRNLTNLLELMKRWTTVLGDAVTQQEALKQKQLELNVAVLNNQITTEQATRAQAAFNLQQREAAEAVRERLGIATQQSIEETKLARLAADAAKFGLDENEVLKAKVIIMREAKDAADALTVRQAYLPGLKQLELDAANTRKGLDTLATQSLNTLADGFADVIVGTKSLADAFKSMTESILRDLVRLALRQTIIGPLAGALSSAFGSGFLSSGLASQNQLSGIGNAGWSTEGFGPGSTVYVKRQSGGMVAGGRGYLVGEAGPELFIPSSAGQIVPGSLQRGGGGSEIIINNFTAADSETKQSKTEGPNGERIVIDIIKKASARGEFDGVNRGRFGMRPAKVR
jgi:hypothetical protein